MAYSGKILIKTCDRAVVLPFVSPRRSVTLIGLSDPCRNRVAPVTGRLSPQFRSRIDAVHAVGLVFAASARPTRSGVAVAVGPSLHSLPLKPNGS